MRLGNSKKSHSCIDAKYVDLSSLSITHLAAMLSAARGILLIALLINVTQVSANEPVMADVSKEPKSSNNDFALAMRQVKITQGFTLKQIERQSSAKVSSTLTKTIWRVDANGYPPAVLAAFESVREVQPTCSIATLRFQRAAISQADFEATSTWHCYE